MILLTKLLQLSNALLLNVFFGTCMKCDHRGYVVARPSSSNRLGDLAPIQHNIADTVESVMKNGPSQSSNDDVDKKWNESDGDEGKWRKPISDGRHSGRNGSDVARRSGKPANSGFHVDPSTVKCRNDSVKQRGTDNPTGNTETPNADNGKKHFRENLTDDRKNSSSIAAELNDIIINSDIKKLGKHFVGLNDLTNIPNGLLDAMRIMNLYLNLGDDKSKKARRRPVRGKSAELPTSSNGPVARKGYCSSGYEDAGAWTPPCPNESSAFTAPTIYFQQTTNSGCGNCHFLYQNSRCPTCPTTSTLAVTAA